MRSPAYDSVIPLAVNLPFALRPNRSLTFNSHSLPTWKHMNPASRFEQQADCRKIASTGPAITCGADSRTWACWSCQLFPLCGGRIPTGNSVWYLSSSAIAISCTRIRYRASSAVQQTLRSRCQSRSDSVKPWRQPGVALEGRWHYSAGAMILVMLTDTSRARDVAVRRTSDGGQI